MEMKPLNISNKLKDLLAIIPIGIEQLHEFMITNRSWISPFSNNYHKALSLLTDAGKDIAIIDNNCIYFGIQRCKDKNTCDTTVMFSNLDGSNMPYFQLQWTHVLYVDFYTMEIQLGGNADIECVGVVVAYDSGEHELLFIEIPESHRNKGYGTALLNEIKETVTNDILLYSTPKAESFYLQNGGLLTEEYKDYKEGKFRKIILRK